LHVVAAHIRRQFATLLNDGKSVKNGAHILEQALRESPAPLEAYPDSWSRPVMEQELNYQGQHDKVAGK
jgi:hypothetical protein